MYVMAGSPTRALRTTTFDRRPVELSSAAREMACMKIVLFGASGLIGQGVLRECLAAADVERVVSIARAPLGVTHELDSDAPRSTGACFL